MAADYVDIKQGEALVFTGERFIPGEAEGDIELEHLHRYSLVCELAKGKRILDVASGEGYGSAMLAAHAAEVTGVDISEDAIRHASDKYVVPNLRFVHGSCSALPLPDAAVDMVVSFETLEHHDQHEAMMREIKRVLQPGGLLVISSPDKLEYSDKPGYVNEFHIKELYRCEFQELLTRHFAHYRLYGQRVAYGSVVLSEDYDGPQQARSFALEDHQLQSYAGVPHAVYLIAVVSDGVLPTLGVGLFDLPLASAPIVKASLEHSARLQRAVDELRATLDSVAVERDAYKQAVSDLEDALRARSSAHDAALARMRELGGLQAAVDELRGTVETLLIERNAYRQAVENLQDALRSQSAEHTRDMDDLREKHARNIDGVRQQLQVAQQDNARGQILIGEHVSRIRELESREAQLMLKQREVEAVREALMLENENQRAVVDAFRDQLAQTYQSRSWRITAPLRKLSSLRFKFLRRRQLLAHSEHASKPWPLQTVDLTHVGSAAPLGVEHHKQALAKTDPVRYRILLVSYYCPTRAHAGGLRILDMYALLRRMCPEVQLDLFTHHRPQIDWSIDEVHSIFDNVYMCEQEDLSPDAFAALASDRSICYDVVDLQFHQSAYYLAAYRKIGHKILFTPMESQAKVLYLEMQEQIRRTGKVGLRKLAVLFKMAFEEISFCRKADAVVCVSKTDAAFIRAVGGGRHVRGIETGLSPFEFSNALSDNFVPPRSKDRSKSIVYVAYFGSETNVKALEWFLMCVHPDIVKAVPGYKLVVVGRGDLSAFHSYAGESVQLVGEVPELEPFIRDANHGIAPALGGSGFRGKVNQYAVLGIPSVTSRIAHKGLAYRDRQSILIADAPEDFARCCIQLLQDDKLNDAIAAAARRVCIAAYGWQTKWPDIATTYGVKEYVR